MMPTMSVPDAPPTLLSRGLAALGRLVAARALFVVLALSSSLVPAGWLALQLDIHASFLDLLPADEEPVRQLHEVIGHARSASDVSIAISTADRAMAERYAEAFVAELEAERAERAGAISGEPEIAGIGGHIEVDWLLERRLLFVPEAELERLVSRAEAAVDRELLRNTGLYVDLEDPAADEEDTGALLREVDASDDRVERDEWVITSDGRYLCLWAFFSGNSGDLAFGRRALARVRAVDARLRDGVRFPRELEVRFAGGIPTRVEDERAIREDLQVAGVVGFFAVVLLIVASLRAPRALVILAVPLFTGLVWTFAFARLAVGHLNIISGFLFSILSGLGIEYGIHLMHRFRELREEGVPLERAIEVLLEKTGRALLSGSMTNASVFAVIAFAQFSGFSEFGLIAAVGLLLTLVSTLVGLPALLVLFERWRPIRSVATESTAHTPVNVPDPVRWGIVVGVPILAVLSVVALARGHVRFDGNWRLLAGNSETTQFQEYLRHHFAGLYTGGLIYVPPGMALSRVVEVIEGVRASRIERGESSDVAEIDTLDEAFPPPDRQRARAALAVRLGGQLDRIRPALLDD
ncbi:MAG: MMPL family transporter, partial [Deltaproteobacteria bacterium]